MISKPLQIIAALALVLTAYTGWRDREDAGESARDSLAREEPPPALKSERRADRISEGADAVDGMVASAPSETTAGAEDVIDIFPQQTWKPVARTEPDAAERIRQSKEAREAPALPFSLGGQWRDAGGLYILIAAHGQQFLLCDRCELEGSIRPGQTVMPSYRIDAVSERELVFTYLPLEERQSLALGDAT